MNVSTTSSSYVLLQRYFGAWLAFVLARLTYQGTYHNTNNGFPTGYLVDSKYIHFVLQPSGKKRNSACFENKRLKNPAEILSYACVLMSYWAGLYSSETQGKILEGVQALLACAHRMMACQPVASTTARILPSTAEEEREDDELIWWGGTDGKTCRP